MTYQPRDLVHDSLECGFFSFSGTPTTNNPLTPAIVGQSSNLGASISSNNIQLPAGEYLLRFFGAITRTTNSHNIMYKWRHVGVGLVGMIGSTNREVPAGNLTNSIDSADAHIISDIDFSVQLEITSAESDLTLDTTSTHAVIWGVS